MGVVNNWAAAVIQAALSMHVRGGNPTE